jgi:hypothetical protein
MEWARRRARLPRRVSVLAAAAAVVLAGLIGWALFIAPAYWD